MPTQSRERIAVYLRSLIFGVEDSLVSTVGLLSGIAISGVERSAILVTGIVLLAVEGFSMAAGSFLSERSVEEYTGNSKIPLHYSIVGGFIMFASYILAGLIPLAPYVFFSNPLGISVVISLVSLFLLGAFSARNFGIHWFSRGIRMLIIGGMAIAMGVAIGNWVPLVR